MGEYVYIGREPCGCVTFVTADSLEHARMVDRDLAYCVRRGLTINRIPIEAFRAMPVGCQHVRVEDPPACGGEEYQVMSLDSRDWATFEAEWEEQDLHLREPGHRTPAAHWPPRQREQPESPRRLAETVRQMRRDWEDGYGERA